MSERNSERVITPMPQALVEAIDDYRFTQRIQSRAEAVRRLIQLGLDAAADGGKGKSKGREGAD